jgi:hypothetical protein
LVWSARLTRRRGGVKIRATVGARRRARGAFVVAAVAASCAVATAVAATPELGAYHWDGRKGGVTFRVVGADPRIEEALATAARCGRNGKSIEVTKPIDVSDSGRFAYDGNAAVAGGGRTQVEYKGKFVTPTKAEGRVDLGGCGRRATLDFKARRLGRP